MDYESNETKARFLDFLRRRGKENGKEDKPIVHDDVKKYVVKFHDSKENHN